MFLGVPASELVLLASMIMAGGAVSGFLAGLFGVGGGGIIVPVLFEIFAALHVPEEVRMQLCVGTSLAIIAPTAWRSFRTHVAQGNVPAGVLRRWTIPIVIGVVAGGSIAAFAPSWVFRLAFVVLAGFIAMQMLFGNKSWRLGDELPGTALMSAYGIFIGLYSSLMGVGGGAVATLILVLYGRPIHAGVAIGAGVGIIIALAGTVSYMVAGWPHQAQMPPFSIGFVSLIGVALMAPVAGFVAPYGARLAHALSRRKLEIAFGCFMLLVALRFLWTLI
ncbi:MAG: sulfite exporter TauE/SafE family protein [Variibacter sp.]